MRITKLRALFISTKLLVCIALHSAVHLRIMRMKNYCNAACFSPKLSSAHATRNNNEKLVMKVLQKSVRKSLVPDRLLR